MELTVMEAAAALGKSPRSVRYTLHERRFTPDHPSRLPY